MNIMRNVVRKIIRRVKNIIGLYLNIPIPRSVSINLTNKCNSRCIYCEIGQGLVSTKKTLLSLDDIKWVINQMNSLGIFSLGLGGGEPFLFKDIFEVVQYSHNFGIKCSILTNGMLLPGLSHEKVKLLKQCKATVNVSIDSFEADKQEYIRGVSNALSFPMEGIKTLVKQRIPVRIMTVISAYNYQDLYHITVEANKLGVTSVDFQPVIFVSCFPEEKPIHNKKNLNVKPEHLKEIKKQFSQIMEFQRVNHITTNINLLSDWLEEYILFITCSKNDNVFFERFLKRLYCSPLNGVIAINYYGDILPCNMLEPSKTIKDRKGKSLLGIWNASCQPVRSLIQRQRYPDACKSCVCGFDDNFKNSIIKYPFSNFKTLFKVLCKRLATAKILVRRSAK